MRHVSLVALILRIISCVAHFDIGVVCSEDAVVLLELGALFTTRTNIRAQDADLAILTQRCVVDVCLIVLSVFSKGFTSNRTQLHPWPLLRPIAVSTSPAVCTAKNASARHIVDKWTQSRYACGNDDGISLDASPDSDVGCVVCIVQSKP